MCGIAGILGHKSFIQENVHEIIQLMADKLYHRGPDDEGFWSDDDASMFLAHRRLSIQDLSSAGHQPMESHCARFVIVFNGEIYNHEKIREEIENKLLTNNDNKGIEWSGHSDTETLLVAISCWGLEATLQKLVGMFAFALWDRKERMLSLVRDRMGEKPLYYCLNDGVFIFASELKALTAYRGFSREVDRSSLELLLRYGQVPAPYTIYKNVFKLLPGTILKINLSQVKDNKLPISSEYWSLRKVAESGQNKIFTGTEAEAICDLERLLRESISDQMIADVPIGAFLSGGIDSTTVVALMQIQSTNPVRTFTIGFENSEYDEAKYAREVAAFLGTEHTELYVSANDALSVIPRLHEVFDEPFADPSQVPTMLLSKLAREHVTVSLSGDGGDELFGGYNRHIWVSSVWRKIHWMPRSLKMAAAEILTTMPPSTWNKIFYGLNVFLPKNWRYKSTGDKLHKLADILAARSPEEIYQGLITHWKRSGEVVKNSFGLAYSIGSLDTDIEDSDLEHRMMYLDSISYLPNDILVKVDRAAMDASLESRIPFLDHRVVEFAWQLPISMKIKNGHGKWIVKQLLNKHVPEALFERPKMGFGIPLDGWLRKELKEWAEDLLEPTRLENEGYFNSSLINKKWKEHLSGKRNWSYHLWDVLMFQAWSSNNS